MNLEEELIDECMPGVRERIYEHLANSAESTLVLD
jgi:hypothetical protein